MTEPHTCSVCNCPVYPTDVLDEHPEGKQMYALTNGRDRTVYFCELHWSEWVNA